MINLEILFMNGYGVYVWPSFIFTFVICLGFYLKTNKTLKKLEKDFIKEVKNLPEKQFEDIKKQKIAKEILISHSRS